LSLTFAASYPRKNTFLSKSKSIYPRKQIEDAQKNQVSGRFVDF